MAVENRLWRPAAQRSVRNGWSYIQGHRSSWSSSSAAALSSATSLVNAHLLHRDVDAMNFGVLADMEYLKDKTRRKLYQNQVQVVSQMTSAAASMRTYGSNSGTGLITFSNVRNSSNEDSGDGGGAPVFSSLPLSLHEMLASEIVSMFQEELRVKWILASEFFKLVYPNPAEAPAIFRRLSFSSWAKNASSNMSSWPERGLEVLKTGDVKIQLEGSKSMSRESLQVYLTTLLGEVYINRDRIEEIMRIINEEMSIGS